MGGFKMFGIGDLVTRKSYNHDIVFKIVNISNETAQLKGCFVRLLANSKIDDLEKYNENRNIDDSVQLPLDNQSYIKGKILHLDGDVEYLKKSMKLYEKYNVPAIGYKLHESEMPNKIEELLKLHNPDILIVTGHDAIDKNGNYINTHYFVKCVKIARKYQPCKDNLCIIAGACFSSFKDLINEGSNISSSPGNVSINVLDPARVAIMIACTSVVEYVDMKKVINLTSNKNKGMGGIETKGFARKIY